jgi:hypothetical protein
MLAAQAWATDAPPVKPASPAGKPAEQTIDLRPRFQPGQTSRYEIWTLRETGVTLAASGRSQSLATRLEIKGEVAWSVEKVNPDGGAVCVMTIDWMTADYTNPQGETTQNDSRRASGGTEAIHKVIRAMAGVPVRVEVGADGSILNASGAEAIERKIGKALHPPDDLDFMESAADLATVIAAPAAAKIKDQWTADNTWNHDMGKMRVALDQTLGSVEEIAGIPVATVTGMAKLTLQPDVTKVLPREALEGPNAAKVDIRLVSGTLTTQVMFDLQRHEAVGRNSTQETQIEMRVRVADQTMTRTINETLQSQALRIEEK